ncbi:hypothetical protein [Leptospira sp. GIMC2001]|uniref:hypothetical protein n=1 Tax=Leptospira sp. GIMC2001 TaxID=1513297 RepID=UPI002349E3D3|nr:hypothetical protein [Leptospira sp. GIMC2001]WCL49713.1 hypothetical protein O4O04_02520 [Leptospira sp. GIMC2001]
MSTNFNKKFYELLSSSDSQHYTELYFEFIDGGDSMYGGRSSVDFDEWSSLSIDDKSVLAYSTLNQKELVVRYPGTFSGPTEEDLQILVGLDELEIFKCDSMMITNYNYLLELPKLNQLTLDLFSHQSKIVGIGWNVFDAFLQIHRDGFYCSVDNLQKYIRELKMLDPFPIDQNVKQDENGDRDLSFITMDYLYKNHSNL